MQGSTLTRRVLQSSGTARDTSTFWACICSVACDLGRRNHGHHIYDGWRDVKDHVTCFRLQPNRDLHSPYLPMVSIQDHSKGDSQAT